MTPKRKRYRIYRMQTKQCQELCWQLSSYWQHSCFSEPHFCIQTIHSVSLSRILYGIEVSEMSNSALRSLGDIHWDIEKRMQGLHRCTPNPSVILSMDGLSLASIIDERRLGVFCRILSLEPSRYDSVLYSIL